MELGFSEEQVLLRDTICSLCADHSDSAAVRAAETSERGYNDGMWQALADTGMTAMLVDEDHGGLGMGRLDSVIVHEELGRKLASTPLLETALMATQLLQAAGREEQRAAWLPAIAAGEGIVIPAWEEAGCSAGVDHWVSEARRDGDSLLLSGEKILVPFANSADAFLLALRYAGELALVLVPADQVRLREQPNHADQKLYAVDFEDVRVPATALLDAGDAALAWEQARLQAQVAVAAQAIGGASAMLEMATAYAQQREQFGQPIGGFQSIAHYLADRATEVEGARYLVYQAAWACDTGQPWAQLAMMAKLQATAVFRRVTVTGVQVHGGMGFSAEADPQLYYRRAKHLQLLYGDPDYLEQRIATEVLG